MAGQRAGVATKIKEVEPRALYIHCMGHSLNLAVQDTCRSVSIINEALDTVLELSKIFKYGAKKKSMLLQIKSELAPGSPGLKPLCPTRWTVRAESLRSVLNNYAVIQSVLEDSTWVQGKCRGHCFCSRGTYCDGKFFLSLWCYTR